MPFSHFTLDQYRRPGRFRLRPRSKTLSIEPLEKRELLAAYDLLPGVLDGESGSLRAAILSANTNGQDDIIRLAAGEYRLTLAGVDEDGNLTGDLDLREAGQTVTIIGAGAESTFISAELLADRVLDIGSDVTVVLVGVTVRGGGGVILGGGVLNLGALELRDSVVEGNSADRGGGVYNGGSLTMSGSHVRGNEATERGGGVASVAAVAMEASSVASNRAGLGDADLLVAPMAPADLWTGDRDVAIDYHMAWTSGFSGSTLFRGGSLLDGSTGLSGAAPGIYSRTLTGRWGDASGAPQAIAAGTLTAGSIDDYESFERFLEFTSKSHETLPQSYPSLEWGDLATIWVTTADGVGIRDARVTVSVAAGSSASEKATLLETRTGTDGRTLFSSGLDGASPSGRYAVTVTAADGAKSVTKIFEADAPLWQVTLVDEAATATTQLDIALVIDTTGSMSDELEYLKAEIDSIFGRVYEEFPEASIRFSLTAYRDEHDAYVTSSFAFTDDFSEFAAQLDQHFAAGGGDYPEAMHTALGEALNLDWRTENTARMLFLVADAPPHDEHAAETLATAQAFRGQGVRIYPVAASGVADVAEYVMRSASFLTQGEYLFLTDHSGIGNTHAAPHVDAYDVERLDQLMFRMIEGELAGRKVPAQSIIDRVTFYASAIIAKLDADRLDASRYLAPAPLLDAPTAAPAAADPLRLLDAVYADAGSPRDGAATADAAAAIPEAAPASIGYEVVDELNYAAAFGDADWRCFAPLF